MAPAVYILCAVTSIACAMLLLRGYTRSRVRLLLWSSLCFMGLALNNVILSIDVLVLPGVDLSAWRNPPALAGLSLLLYGLIWDTE